MKAYWLRSTFNWLLKAFFISWFTRDKPRAKSSSHTGLRKGQCCLDGGNFQVGIPSNALQTPTLHDS